MTIHLLPSNQPSLESFAAFNKEARSTEYFWKNSALRKAQDKSVECPHNPEGVDQLCRVIAKEAFEGFQKQIESSTKPAHFELEKRIYLDALKAEFNSSLGFRREIKQYLKGEKKLPPPADSSPSTSDDSDED